jgi:hypothetical protein
MVSMFSVSWHAPLDCDASPRDVYHCISLAQILFDMPERAQLPTMLSPVGQYSTGINPFGGNELGDRLCNRRRSSWKMELASYA